MSDDLATVGVMAVMVHELSVAEARERCDELLHRLGADRSTIDARARDFALTEDESAQYDELLRLEYLLGE